MAGFIPNSDADRIAWGLNFSTLISADPALYGVSVPVAAFIQSQYDEFAAAYALAVDPATSTVVTVALKDEEMAGFISIARAIAAQIRANGAVTNENKLALGLTVADPTPTPIPPPTTTPVIVTPLAGVGQVLMNVADSLTPNSKAKPYGVQGMLLMRASGPTLPLNFEDAQLHSIIQRADTLVDTSDLPSGVQTTYWGRWFSTRGAFGPLGAPTSIATL